MTNVGKIPVTTFCNYRVKKNFFKKHLKITPFPELNNNAREKTRSTRNGLTFGPNLRIHSKIQIVFFSKAAFMNSYFEILASTLVNLKFNDDVMIEDFLP